MGILEKFEQNYFFFSFLSFFRVCNSIKENFVELGVWYYLSVARATVKLHKLNREISY